MPPFSPDNLLHIVMAASEAVPYAKTGGLADVTGALPHELVQLGHRVTLMLPAYPQPRTERRPRRTVTRLTIPTAGAQADVAIEEEDSSPGRPAPRVLVVRYDPYFDRPGLYQSPEGDYPDNLDRFVLFSRAVLETIHWLHTAGEPVDLLHLHDWQTALCAVYLKNLTQDYSSLSHLKTLLTLHNVGYQGVFPGREFAKIGLPSALFAPNALEFYGSVNVLKGGIIFSDVVSTVSPTYAKEILTKEYGSGLEGVLAGRADGVRGITNGIDVTIWDPASDRYLPAHYTIEDPAAKRICKQALQRELGLPVVDVPLLALIGRLTHQKGFDLVLDVLSELMALDVQLAILGTGDRELERRLATAQAQYADRIGLQIGFDEGLAHRIVAGADMLLMPSRYEPCGLTQLYSLRYGTIPIVRRTGGLADTVVPFKPSTAQSKRATGFHFIEPSGDALLPSLLLALAVYKDQRRWRSLVKAGMQTDVSWTQSARQYLALYRSLQQGLLT
jgi:starch synthase